jgi:hypothetical protein
MKKVHLDKAETILEKELEEANGFRFPIWRMKLRNIRLAPGALSIKTKKSISGFPGGIITRSRSGPYKKGCPIKPWFQASFINI